MLQVVTTIASCELAFMKMWLHKKADFDTKKSILSLLQDLKIFCSIECCQAFTLPCISLFISLVYVADTVTKCRFFNTW